MKCQLGGQYLPFWISILSIVITKNYTSQFEIIKAHSFSLNISHKYSNERIPHYQTDMYESK